MDVWCEPFVIWGGALIRTLIGALITIILGGVGAWARLSPVSAAARAHTTQSQSAEQTRKHALLTGGLHGAAIAAGGTYRFFYDPNPEAVVADLESFAKQSDAVVIGDVIANECHMALNERYITTDYRVRVIESLLGPHATGDEIILSVPGGRLQFPDGTAAQMEVKQFASPLNGDRLVVFGHQVKSTVLTGAMNEWAGRDVIYSPVMSTLSVISLSNDDSIQFRGRLTDPVVKAYHNKPVAGFLHDLRKAVKEAEKARRK